MAYNYDPHTGRRVFTTLDRFYDAEWLLNRWRRDAAEARRVLKLTPWQRFRVSSITTAVSSAAMIAFIVLSVHAADAESRGATGAGAFLSGIVLLIAAGTIFEHIGDARGGSAKEYAHELRGVARQKVKVDELRSKVEHERVAEIAARKRKEAEPSTGELLAAVVSTASRSAALTDSDAALWAVIAADPDDLQAWAAIGDANGWSAELTRKVQAAGASNRAVPPAAARPRVMYKITRDA